MMDSAYILEEHTKLKGKVAMKLTSPLDSREALSISYTPGVAIPAREITIHPEKVWDYTGRRNRVAIVTDGTAVLGLGNIGPLAALPVMEGKSALFKRFADIDAFPICLNARSSDEIIDVIKAISPSFGGINLEDIAAPRCFEVEEALKREIDIPVFHDDQHGTAIVVMAGLMNAMKVTKRVRSGKWKVENDLRIVISGAGAAGTAITRMLLSQGMKNILVVDSRGIISRNRNDLNTAKTFLAASTNPENLDGNLEDAVKKADAFIGVSKGGLLTQAMIRSMAKDPIIFALANPIPEIMPDEAKEAGARIIATGRSDFPNQMNNVLAFPGIFLGAIKKREAASSGQTPLRQFTSNHFIAAAHALAGCVSEPTAEKILPDPFEEGVAQRIAEAVEKVNLKTEN